MQKYVENPFLVNNRKFDLRQWVLVTSWEPLDVFVFDTCYLRLCSADYSLNDLQDSYKHLSNFTIQKAASDSSDTHVMQVSELEEKVGDKKLWENKLFPAIKDVVFKTLKGV